MGSSNTESSISMKLQPMPMSALLNLLPVQRSNENSDCSYDSVNDSDNSLLDTVDCKPKKNVEKELISSTPIAKTKEVTVIEKKNSIVSGINKENYDLNLSSRTYPNKDTFHRGSAIKNTIMTGCPHSEMKKRTALMPHNNNFRFPGIKKTPDMVKASNSSQKTKPSTPVLKSGIRKFTPGSARKSHKKTPQKFTMDKNRDSVRCLFPENQVNEELKSAPRPSQNEVVTPLNKKPLPPTLAATPSYPQGMVGHHSKLLFKTTNIKGRNYMYIRKLGVGGSSEVYKVLEVNTSREYAVKCVNLSTDPEMAQGYINEIRLLRQLQDSDRVIRLYDYEYDKSNQFLRVVLEVGETDLSSFLRARGTGLPPALVLHYWEEMLYAVDYIHEHGVIHADLKPANFLLVSGRLKLIDFGIASAISSDATSVVRSQATGTYSYISPEALGGGGGDQPGDPAIKISFRSDVWSLGCILYSLVYGRTPFGQYNSLAKLAAILDPNHRINYPPVEHLPPALIRALKWCLTYEVRRRPSVRDLLAIPYLQSAPANPPAPTSPLSRSLLDKLRSLVSPEEFTQLQRRLNCDCQKMRKSGLCRE